MDKSEFLQAIQTIGALEDVAQMRTLLTELGDNVSAVFDTNSDLTEKYTALQTDNESLRSANMKLFLRIGEQKSDTEVTKDVTGLTQTEEPVKRDFKNLFNEKGGLI